MKPELLDHASLLSDATRCRILLALEAQELTVTELCAVLQAPQSTVSRHLKLLRETGWIDARTQATRHYYRTGVDALPPATRRLWLLLRDSFEGTPAASGDRQRLGEVMKARRQASEHFFETAAGEWDAVRESLFGGAFDLLALPAFLDPELEVGDLGCGTGRLSELLSPFVRRVVAVDASAQMLVAARERLAGRGNVEIREGELEALPLADASLDLVAIFLALHHVADPGRVLREATRVLRPGGSLVVVDMQAHDRADYQTEMGHVWLGFSRERFRSLCREAGIDEPAYRELPPALDAKGPGLFVARARRSDPSLSASADSRLPSTSPEILQQGVQR
ncbi:MAG: metalloregulator ArsR/SmtB family transcription factor [Thermoanaerobaculia bacterium]|nr:metalloregulator ArsR/SmtB family transcription factor [Thermoanaerobaculia bacterium]